MRQNAAPFAAHHFSTLERTQPNTAKWSFAQSVARGLRLRERADRLGPRSSGLGQRALAGDVAVRPFLPACDATRRLPEQPVERFPPSIGRVVGEPTRLAVADCRGIGRDSAVDPGDAERAVIGDLRSNLQRVKGVFSSGATAEIPMHPFRHPADEPGIINRTALVRYLERQPVEGA